MLIKTSIAGLSLALLAGHASADPCLSPLTKFDVCKAAREFHSELAPLLPMQLNANITLERAAALGPTFVMYAGWAQTWPEVEARLHQAGMTKDAFIEKMNEATASMVCGQEVTAAFVRLGGKISYHYRTLDHVPLTVVTVDACPRD